YLESHSCDGSHTFNNLLASSTLICGSAPGVGGGGLPTHTNERTRRTLHTHLRLALRLLLEVLPDHMTELMGQLPRIHTCFARLSTLWRSMLRLSLSIAALE